MATRDEKFWYPVQFKVDLIEFNHDKDLSMDNVLDDEKEKRSCNKLVVVGALLDGYIEQLAKGFLNKLSNGKLTGVQESHKLYFPYCIYVQFAKLVTAYGGKISISRNKKDKLNNILTLTVKTEEVSRKLFHPRRLKGITYLAKRKYVKEKGTNGKVKSVFKGHGRIVITDKTPLTITYKMKTQCCSMSYYIQRYNIKNEALDIRLQALLNGLI